MALSRERADAVADWLARSAGFARARLATEGWGGSKPAYPDDSAADRDRNRRVVVTVLQP
jgi:type VI secretion system protein ImpK